MLPVPTYIASVQSTHSKIDKTYVRDTGTLCNLSNIGYFVNGRGWCCKSKSCQHTGRYGRELHFDECVGYLWDNVILGTQLERKNNGIKMS